MGKAHHVLLDAHDHHQDEIQTNVLKLADLEDRSRRNNIKFRGIPESVSFNELKKYLQQLFATLLPNLSPHDLLIDRAHRIAKPNPLPAETPRAVLARINRFPHKETNPIHGQEPQTPTNALLQNIYFCGSVTSYNGVMQNKCPGHLNSAGD